MKVFLRSKNTGLFYAGPDTWTSDSTQAFEFRGPDTALDVVSDGNLPAMEVVIHFEEARFDLPLNIVGLGK
ncbi:MAG TPA: hypothetical protein VHH88_02280 [Verrucomicrobiae bacterium]|jgi:hypothetical protein|nr:hypothetical protein [Verrucomicrobiae bacterium]